MAKLPTHLKVTLLVPLIDNDGQPFELQTWSWWNDRLTSVVSGFTDHGVEARHRFRQEAMYLEYHRVFFEEVQEGSSS